MTVTYIKHRKKWRYNFRFNGRRYSTICIDPDTGHEAETRTEAKSIEDKIRARVKDGKTKRLPTALDYTIAQGFAAFLARRKGTDNFSNVKTHAKELMAWFGPNTLLTEIVESRLTDYVNWSRQQKIKIWTGGPAKPNDDRPNARRLWKELDRVRSQSLINRYLATLGTMLREAHQTRNPHTGLPLLPFLPKIPSLKEPKRLPRPIAPVDLEALIAAAPPHLADAIRLTALMGFRKAEVFGLTTRHVDLNQRGIWLRAEETKAERDEFIPASDMAMEILRRLKTQAESVGLENLILYRFGGKKSDVQWRPIKESKKAWQTALKKCGLQGRHVFHNLKASFVTAVGKHMPAAAVQSLARHQSFSTTQRYLLVVDDQRRAGVAAAEASLRSGNVIPIERGKELKRPSKLHTKVTHKEKAKLEKAKKHQ